MPMRRSSPRNETKIPTHSLGRSSGAPPCSAILWPLLDQEQSIRLLEDLVLVRYWTITIGIAVLHVPCPCLLVTSYLCSAATDPPPPPPPWPKHCA